MKVEHKDKSIPSGDQT